MKLYAWRPKGHGPMSFFVAAATEADARAAVAAEIERHRSMPNGSLHWWDDYDHQGWPDEDYELTVAEPGHVVINCNE